VAVKPWVFGRKAAYAADAWASKIGPPVAGVPR